MQTRHFIRSGLLNLVGWCATFAAGLGTWAIMARSLGPDELGLYGYSVWIGATFSALATLGLPFTSEKYVAQYSGSGDRARAAAVCRRLLRTQIIVASLVCLVAVIVLVYFRPLRQPVVAILVVAYVAPSALQVALRSILSGFYRFALANVIAVLTAVFQLGLVISVAMMHGGVVWMLLVNLLSAIFSVAFSIRAVQKILAETDEGGSRLLDTSTTRAMWRFSLIFSYVSLLEYIVWDKSEVFFLKKFSSLSELAFYSVAFAASAKLVVVAQSFADLMLPFASHEGGRTSTPGLGNMFVQASRLMLLILVPLSAGAVLISKPAVAILYGDRFGPVVFPLQVLVSGIPIASLSAVGWAIVAAADHERLLAKAITVAALFSILADYFLIREYGALGAAVATTGAQWFIAILLVGIAMRLTRTAFPWLTLVRAYTAAVLAIMPAILLRTKTGPLIFATGIAIGLYPLALWMLGEIKKTDVRRLWTIVG